MLFSPRNLLWSSKQQTGCATQEAEMTVHVNQCYELFCSAFSCITPVQAQPPQGPCDYIYPCFILDTGAYREKRIETIRQSDLDYFLPRSSFWGPQACARSRPSALSDKRTNEWD